MALIASRTITWSSTDLGVGNVSSEILDIRDLKFPMTLCSLTGSPQGNLQVYGYVGTPVRTSSGWDWSLVDNYLITQSAAAGVPIKIPYIVSTPLSAIQLVFSRTSGSGTIKGVFQAKETRTQ